MKKSLAIAITIVLGFSSSVHATKMSVFENGKSGFQTNNKVKSEQLYVISNKHVNRIVTPFNNPSIKLDNVEGVAYKARDNVLYLSTQHDADIGGWITEGGDETTAIRVLFKPMSIPPAEVILEDEMGNGSPLAKRFEQSSPRTTTIINILSELSVGNLPSGYKQEEINASYLPKCQQDGLTFEFYNGQFFSGGDYVVSIGTVKNETVSTIEFKENNCYQDGVVAINAYPNANIKSNTQAEVLVMYHRIKAAARKDNKRQSLINKGQQ